MRIHVFHSKKVTEVAALLLKLRGGTMHYIKLIKLLYLVDREALRRLGRHVSGDNHASMDNGPVLSNTYNLIREQPRDPRSSFWHQHISAPHDYQVTKLNDPGDDDLSEAETDIVSEVFKQYGHWNRWDLVDYTHTLPEWRDPDGSSLPIHIREMLQHQGFTPERAAAIEKELEEKREIALLF